MMAAAPQPVESATPSVLPNIVIPPPKITGEITALSPEREDEEDEKQGETLHSPRQATQLTRTPPRNGQNKTLSPRTMACSEVLLQVEKLVKGFLLQPGSTLKCRLIHDRGNTDSEGEHGQRKSQSGPMSFDTFHRLYTALERSSMHPSTRIKSHGKTHVVEYVYDNAVTTRYVLGRAAPSVSTQAIHFKTSVTGMIDMVADARPGVVLRATLETTRHVDTVSVTRPPLYVVMAEQWRFTYGNNVEYVLSKSVQGVDKESACKMRPELSVSIELLRGETVRVHGTEVVAAKYLAKVVDLLGRHRREGPAQEEEEIGLKLLYVQDPTEKGPEKKKKKRSKKKRCRESVVGGVEQVAGGATKRVK